MMGRAGERGKLEVGGVRKEDGGRKGGMAGRSEGGKLDREETRDAEERYGSKGMREKNG